MLDRLRKVSRPADQLMGACLQVPCNSFAALGGFYECFFICDEDVDLALRARRFGQHSGFETRMAIVYFGGSISRRGSARP
jgi:GT2 family glycosyltransferase